MNYHAIAMKPEQVIQFYGDGNMTVAARAIGISRQTLYNWLKADKVPALWQAWIETHSKGKLRANKEKR